MLPTPKEFNDDRMFITPSISPNALLPENPNWAQRLLGRYGAVAQTLLSESTSEDHASIGDTDFSLAECRWAIKYEGVQHLDDLLLRRTRLGMCLANGGADLYPALEALFKTERQWNSEQWDTELNRYKAIWQDYYSLPQNS